MNSEPTRDTRNADGEAYQRVTQRYVATCPVLYESMGELVPCPWKGRRNDHESDSWTDIAGHLRRDHANLNLVTLRTFRQTVMWEPIEGTTAEEE